MAVLIVTGDCVQGTGLSKYVTFELSNVYITTTTVYNDGVGLLVFGGTVCRFTSRTLSSHFCPGHTHRLKPVSNRFCGKAVSKRFSCFGVHILVHNLFACTVFLLKIRPPHFENK